jgi:predicted MFS family arabinose efflux permease
VRGNTPTPPANAVAAKQRWVILGVVYLCSLCFGILVNAIPPILSLVMDEFQLTYAQGGLLSSLFALPGIAIAIPAGMLADRYGQKTIGIISFILMIAGTAIFASGNSFPVLALGRVLTGAGCITLLVLAPQILAQWFTGREMGTAMGIYNTSVPVGAILALNLLAMLGQNLGWRASAWLSAVVPLIAMIAFVFLFAPAPGTGQRAQPKGESPFKSIRMAGIAIWIIGIAWMLFNAAASSMFTFTPEFLQGSGVSLVSAGFITSAAMWPSALLSPAVGYLTDRVDRKRTIIAIGGIGMAIFLVMIPTATSWILALMLLIGVAQALVPAPIFALTTEVVSPKRLGMGFGILTTFLNLGIMVGPVAVGAVIDATGSYQASYTLMAGVAFVITLAMLTLYWRQKHI